MKSKSIVLSLFTTSFLFFGKFAIAQNSNQNPTAANPFNPLNTYLNNFVQPAPNAGSLGKYADYPVAYYTGVPQISIPVYDLKDGGINLPISLSYHASGIKVSELASWVGLGWALNATGVINRTVRGAPDEGSRKSNYAPSGYYKDHGLMAVSPMNYPVAPDNHLSDPQGLFYTTVVNGILQGGTDCEPDLYTFNFNGHTGKFVFDEKGTPRLLEDDNLKIRVNYNSTTQHFDSWVITAEDGVQYYFGENNATEMTRPRGNSIEDADDVAPSSWYLTRIVNPNTKETATFNYEYEEYAYHDLGPESKLYGASGGFQNDVSFATDNESLNGFYVDNLITTAVQGLKLTSIVTNNFTVKFIAENKRMDLDSATQGWKNPDNTYQSNPVYRPANMLDIIKVYTNKDNACVKQVILAHGYFSSTSSGTGPSVLNSVRYGSDTLRLKLTSVTETTGDGSLSKPPYLLSYQESFQLPRRLSYDQDHWGYSNNSAGNNNNYFTPPTFTTVSTYAGGAYRHPKWPDMSAFSLVTITDPLGAVTNFTYGANSAGNGLDPDQQSTPADTLVGGLRIQQISVTDNVSSQTKIRSFSYNIPGTNQPGGDVRHYPVYLIQPQNEYYQNTNDANTGLYYNTGYMGNGKVPTGTTLNRGVQILKQSSSIVPMQDANGNHIVYPYVTETFGAGGIGGHKIYHFAEQSETAQLMSSKLDYLTYMIKEDMLFQAPFGVYNAYYGTGHLNDTTADPDMLPVNLANHYINNDNQMYYPFAPKQIDVVSGKLLEEDIYDVSNNLVESATNTYSTNYHENFWIRGLKAYVQNLIASEYDQGQEQYKYNVLSLFNGLTFYKLHTGVSHLVSTVKKTYNGNNYVTEVSHYGYDSPYHTLKTSDTTTSSQGDTYIKRTYYSFDYANSATSDTVFAKMKARNLLFPVSSSTWKNGTLVEGKITKFKDFSRSYTDTVINPSTVYALESVTPLTPVQANESIGWGGQLTTLIPSSYFKPKVTFNYDSYNSRLVNQQLTNNINHAVAWDNQLSLPIAVVNNAYNQTYTSVTNSSSTGSASLTLPSSGGTVHYTTPITVIGTGNAVLTLAFSGNPNTAGNPMAVVSCTITGTTSTNTAYASSIQQLCICAGSASCGGGVNTRTITGIPAGQYTLTVYYAAPPTLFSNVYVEATYPATTTTMSIAGNREFYYEGFEQSPVTNTDPGIFNTQPAHTGNNFWNGAYTVNYTTPDARSYVITYWYLSAGVWKYQPEQPYTGTSMALTGGTAYDDIRIYPSDAQMTTYTYDPAGNITSSMDAKGLTTYYEYDSFQRLMNIKDKDGNIVKSYSYHYAVPSH